MDSSTERKAESLLPATILLIGVSKGKGIKMDQFQKSNEYNKKISGYIDKLDYSKQKKQVIKRSEFELIKRCKEINSIQGGFLVMLFSIIIDGENSVRYLFNSMVKQRSFNKILQGTLMYVDIKKEDMPCFEWTVKKMEDRINKIKSVMDEIMQETKYYIYYKHLIKSDFVDVVVTSEFKNDSKMFVEMADEYNNLHLEEYNQSIVKMNELIELRNKFREDKKNKAIAEKNEIKARKKKEDDEIKEIKLNKKKDIREDKKLGSSGNHYCYNRL